MSLNSLSSSLKDFSKDTNLTRGLANIEGSEYELKLLEYQNLAQRRSDASNIAADSFKPNLDIPATEYHKSLEKYKDLIDEGIEKHFLASYEVQHNVMMGHLSKRLYEEQHKTPSETKRNQMAQFETPESTKGQDQKSANKDSTKLWINLEGIQEPDTIPSTKQGIESPRTPTHSSRKGIKSPRTPTHLARKGINFSSFTAASKQAIKNLESGRIPLIMHSNQIGNKGKETEKADKGEKLEMKKYGSERKGTQKTQAYEFAEKQMKHNVERGRGQREQLIP